MIEFFTLKKNFSATQFFRHALGKPEWAGAADIIFQIIIQLLPESRISLGDLIGLIQFQNEGHKGFRYKTAPMTPTKMPPLIRLVPEGIAMHR